MSVHSMQLQRYKIFLDRVLQSKELSGLPKVQVYRRSGDGWYNGDGTAVDDPEQRRRLALTLTWNGHWRLPNGFESFFPISGFQAVVVATFVSPTRKNTRNSIQEVLSAIAERAAVEYDATYDSLTGLLNSRSLERALKEVLAAVPTDGTAATAEINPVYSVALAGLDLDHFKQINDSFGHDYGDAVLRCFANRLENVIKKLRSEFGETVQLRVFRSGGEEFMIVMAGNLALDRVKAIAERVRSAVAEDELPTDDEWESLSAVAEAHGITLPHVTDRKVTTSVGLSSLRACLKMCS